MRGLFIARGHKVMAREAFGIHGSFQGHNGLGAYLSELSKFSKLITGAFMDYFTGRSAHCVLLYVVDNSVSIKDTLAESKSFNKLGGRF
jgi:hypothetical protein